MPCTTQHPAHLIKSADLLILFRPNTVISVRYSVDNPNATRNRTLKVSHTSRRLFNKRLISQQHTIMYSSGTHAIHGVHHPKQTNDDITTTLRYPSRVTISLPLDCDDITGTNV